MNADAKSWLDRVRAAWNERAAQWDEMSEANARAPDRPADLERTVAALQLQPGSRLLDAGCGTGQFAIAFAERGCRVTGVDLAPAMIERAWQHGEERGVTVEWRVGEISRLADPEAAYDAIHARVVLQFVPNVVETLREFRRVLAPGGRLLASVPGALSPIYRSSWRRFLAPDNFTMNLLMPWELEALLEELGWRVVDGWGEFGESLSGETNPLSAEEISRLDRRLQQAAATTWTVIAE